MVMGEEAYNETMGVGVVESKLTPEQRQKQEQLNGFIVNLDRNILPPLAEAKARTSKRRGVRGYEPNLIQNFVSVAERMAHQMASFQVRPEITEGFAQLEKLKTKERKGINRVGKNRAILAEEDLILDVVEEMTTATQFSKRTRKEYIRNPVNSKAANRVAAGVFRYFLKFNPSSGMVNLSSTRS